MNEHPEYSFLEEVFGRDIADDSVMHYYRPRRGFACGAALNPLQAAELDDTTCPRCWEAIQ